MSGGAHQWGEEGEGLTRTESLPALRVVGFDPSPTSSLKDERNKLSLSSTVSSFSPVAVSSPLSALLGNTGKSDRGGESGFFSAESSDSDRGDQARRELESDATARSILGAGSQEEETLSLHRTDSFAQADPIDIPYRRGHAKHWRRCALRHFPSQKRWTRFSFGRSSRDARNLRARILRARVASFSRAHPDAFRPSSSPPRRSPPPLVHVEPRPSPPRDEGREQQPTTTTAHQPTDHESSHANVRPSPADNRSSDAGRNFNTPPTPPHSRHHRG